MTDLEATRLCAEAMGLKGLHPIAEICPIFKDETVRTALVEKDWGDDEDALFYDPLHIDEQAMALVKQFNLDIEWFFGLSPAAVVVSNGKVSSEKISDLNRAIVYCVAQIKKAASA